MALIDQISRFRRDRSGNIAIIFAISVLPLLVGIGCAVDFSIAMKQRTKIQAALDDAVLAGAIAGKQSLDNGSGQTAAIAAANSAAASFFSGNTVGTSAAQLTTKFTLNGRNLSGTGSAAANVPNTFMKMVGFPTFALNLNSQSTSSTQPYLNVYLLVDISASMLLPSTTAGITQMINGTGCALACHSTTDGTDSYSYALNNNIQLRYQVVNQGVQNLLNYLAANSSLSSHVKVQLWSLDSSLAQLSSMTSSYSAITNNFPAPAVAVDDAAAATPFNNLIGNFISAVGNAGDGSSASNPQKMVILATDGVNDPTRAWASTEPQLMPQVKVFDTTFCSTFKQAGVTVAIINTPYYPMPWDWGYQDTLGQPGSLGGATRVDDIPIALSACAGKNYTLASSVSAIQSGFVNLFIQASPIRLTN
jgi:Flp pilus assembly protein TadG